MSRSAASSTRPTPSAELVRGQYIAGDLLDHAVHWHESSRAARRFQATAARATCSQANDTWFAPSDLTLGPDGALYVADWHDRRTAHPDPDADWDRPTAGSIASRRSTEPSRSPGIGPDPEKLSNQATCVVSSAIQHLVRPQGPSPARRRRDPAAWPGLKALLQARRERPTLGLEALWALAACGRARRRASAPRFSIIRMPEIRTWAVRLLGDENEVPAAIASRLVALAEGEPDVRVRASSPAPPGGFRPQRGPRPGRAARSLAMTDRDDPHIPLLLWWAVERHAVADRRDRSLASPPPDAWRSAMVDVETILGRLVRRFAAERLGRCRPGVRTIACVGPRPDERDRSGRARRGAAVAGDTDRGNRFRSSSARLVPLADEPDTRSSARRRRPA